MSELWHLWRYLAAFNHESIDLQPKDLQAKVSAMILQGCNWHKKLCVAHGDSEARIFPCFDVILLSLSLFHLKPVGSQERHSSCHLLTSSSIPCHAKLFSSWFKLNPPTPLWRWRRAYWGANSYTKCLITFVHIAVAISALAGGGGQTGFRTETSYWWCLRAFSTIFGCLSLRGYWNGILGHFGRLPAREKRTEMKKHCK